MPPARAPRPTWYVKKRRQSADAADDDATADSIEMQQLFRGALTLKQAESTFDMDSKTARAALAAALWSRNPMLCSSSSANVELASVLEVLVRNKYSGGAADDLSAREAYEQRKSYRLEGMLTNLHRCQSQKQMPLLTARFSIAAARCQLHGAMWRGISLLAPGILASEKWTDGFIAFARDMRPPCEYAALEGVGGVMFDNYTRKVLYSSVRTVESGGYLLNMTNSATFTIPKSLAPAFDANEQCNGLSHLIIPLLDSIDSHVCARREESFPIGVNGPFQCSIPHHQPSDSHK